MADKVQPAPPAPVSRDLTSGFDTGFTPPGDSIKMGIEGTLNGTGTVRPQDSGAGGPVRVTAADRAAKRNRVGDDDKPMFNQLGRFDEKPSSAAQGTLSSAAEADQMETKPNKKSFAGMKYS